MLHRSECVDSTTIDLNALGTIATDLKVTGITRYQVFENMVMVPGIRRPYLIFRHAREMPVRNPNFKHTMAEHNCSSKLDDCELHCQNLVTQSDSFIATPAI